MSSLLRMLVRQCSETPRDTDECNSPSLDIVGQSNGPNGSLLDDVGCSIEGVESGGNDLANVLSVLGPQIVRLRVGVRGVERPIVAYTRIHCQKQAYQSDDETHACKSDAGWRSVVQRA